MRLTKNYKNRWNGAGPYIRLYKTNAHNPAFKTVQLIYSQPCVFGMSSGEYRQVTRPASSTHDQSYLSSNWTLSSSLVEQCGRRPKCLGCPGYLGKSTTQKAKLHSQAVLHYISLCKNIFNIELSLYNREVDIHITY